MAPSDTHRVSVTSKHSRLEDYPDYDNEGLTCPSDAVYHGLNPPRFLQCPPLYPQIMGKYTTDVQLIPLFLVKLQVNHR